MLSCRNDHHIGPARFEIGGPSRLDRFVLRGPEAIAIGKIGVLVKQIGDGGKPARINVEQSVFDRDRLPAEQP